MRYWCSSSRRCAPSIKMAASHSVGALARTYRMHLTTNNTGSLTNYIFWRKSSNTVQPTRLNAREIFCVTSIVPPSIYGIVRSFCWLIDDSPQQNKIYITIPPRTPIDRKRAKSQNPQNLMKFSRGNCSASERRRNQKKKNVFDTITIIICWKWMKDTTTENRSRGLGCNDARIGYLSFSSKNQIRLPPQYLDNLFKNY